MAAKKYVHLEKGFSSNISKARQGINYEEVFGIADHRIRIKIYIDSYDFQSHAYAEVWNPGKLEWSRVANIPYSDMASLSYQHLSVLPKKPVFQQDIDILKGKTRFILQLDEIK